MIKKVTMEKVIPKGDNVLVHIQKLPKTTESGIFVGTTNEFSSSRLDIDNYTATVISIGNQKSVDKICPGVKVGDGVLFSQFSGYHVPTGREIFAKLIPAHDIHCKVDNPMKLNLDKAQPVGERLLLEVVVEDETVTETGIIVGKQEKDPRELDSEECIVRGISTLVKEDYEVGDKVYIPAYVGNSIIDDSGRVFKTVNVNDILFVVK